MFEQRERNQLQNLKLPIFMQIYSMLKDHDDASVSGRGTIFVAEASNANQVVRAIIKIEMSSAHHCSIKVPFQL